MCHEYFRKVSMKNHLCHCTRIPVTVQGFPTKFPLVTVQVFPTKFLPVTVPVFLTKFLLDTVPVHST